MNHDDPILRALSELQALEPDGARSERLRQRCDALARRRFVAVRRREGRRRVFESLLVGGFSLAYVIALVHRLIDWRRIQ